MYISGIKKSVFPNAICYFIFRNFYFPSRSNANLLTVFSDRIARVLTSFGATQKVVFDISKTGILVFFTNLSYVAL